MTIATSLPLGAATELAHALATRVAETNLIRVVFIKGPIANEHQLREAKESGDVDIMVDPSRIDDYIRLLTQAGWRERPTSFAQRRFASHSRSFLHPSWPCDIDVHLTFPGFLAAPQDCFEALWARHVSMTVASRPIPAADLLSSILVSALHGLRSPESEAHRVELQTLVARCEGRLHEQELRELTALAMELGAVEPARPFLELIGVEMPSTPAPAQALAQWRLQSHQANRSGSWLAEIHAAPLRSKPGLVLRALFPSRSDLEIEQPMLGGSASSLWLARIRRLIRAIRALPSAIEEFLVHRSSIRTESPPIASLASLDEPIVASAAGVPAPVLGGGEGPGSSLSATGNDAIDPADPHAEQLCRTHLIASVPAPDDGVFVVNLREVSLARPIQLNAVATDVWELIAEPISLVDLARALAGRFDVSVDVVRTDLDGLIGQLHDYGLIDGPARRAARDAEEAARERLSVSCVIPTHNRDESMLAALDSVRQQTYRPERIVVVDDTGSPSTRAAVESIAKTDGRVVYRDASDLPQKAAGASRNAGAESVTTDLIAFLDDDDTWHPEFLESAIAEIERSGSHLVVTWGSLRRGETVLEHNWKAETGFTAAQVLTANPGVTGSNFVIRRAAFTAIGGFDPALWVYNDLDFFVRFLDAGLSYTVVRRDLVRQISTGGAHLSSRSERRARGIEAYLAKYADRLSVRQRRALVRSIHLARLFRDQTKGRRIVHVAGAIANSTASDSICAVRRRLTKAPSYN